MNAWEFTHTVLETASTVLELAESGAQPVSAVLHIIPGLYSIQILWRS
jgi:hypothetical protein